MKSEVPCPVKTGIEVVDLRDAAEFQGRRLRVRDLARQRERLQRLGRAFVDSPEMVLQELVDSAVSLCGADSAGISVERPDKTEAEYYHWIATAGEYAEFLNAVLPQHPSACGVCLERDRPQLFRVSQPFFDLMGIKAATVTDGLLLPWHVDELHGTIWLLAHGRETAFDSEDVKLMVLLTELVAIAVGQERQKNAPSKKANAAEEIKALLERASNLH